MDVYSPGMTALGAFSTKLSGTASNLANLRSVGYKARRVHMVEIPGGGVSVVVSRDLSPGTPISQVPGTPEQSQPLEGSNVELVRELVDLITTRRAYQANARAFRSMAETKGRVLDIVG